MVLSGTTRTFVVAGDGLVDSPVVPPHNLPAEVVGNHLMRLKNLRLRLSLCPMPASNNTNFSSHIASPSIKYVF